MESLFNAFIAAPIGAKRGALSTPGKAGTFFGVTIGSFEGILGTLDALCLEKPSANCLSIISEFRVHLGR